MVDAQIRARGVSDPAVLAALETVPRELFVPVVARDEAYDDHPIAIGHGQTISQPYIVALMTALVRASPRAQARIAAGAPLRILEIGAGSGYQTAVLAALGARVVALELLQPLADRAALTLAALGARDALVLCRDGRLGAPAEHVPPDGFDGVLVAAASADVPEALRAQLGVGARLVIPIGSAFAQELTTIERTAEGFSEKAELAVRFVPLVRG